MTYDIELQVAKTALRQAALLTSGIQKKLLKKDVLEKEDRSPVTVADFGSQALVNRILAENFPLDPMIAEEGSVALREEENQALKARLEEEIGKLSDLKGEAILKAIDHGRVETGTIPERFWTLDPIDGTKGFLRGDHYAIALALIEKGKIRAAALACPNMLLPSGEKGLLMLASENKETVYTSLFSDGPEVKAEARQPLEFQDALICESVESGHTSHSRSALIKEALGITKDPYRIDSQCKYAAVAMGLANIYLRLPSQKGYKEKIWDHAAGKMIVERAGGAVTDTLGAPLDFTTPPLLENNLGVVASKNIDHAKLIAAVKNSE